MNLGTRTFAAVVLTLLLPANHLAHAASATREFDDGRLWLRLTARTPQQIAAFYIGRKFPANMIDVARKQCFFTVVIRNRSDKIIWLDLARWRFIDRNADINRLDRAWWQQQWQRLKAPMASQSTFRWTLLPASLDFHPGETEGGNLTLPRSGRRFSIEALFPTEADGSGKPIRVRFDDLRCAEDPKP